MKPNKFAQPDSAPSAQGLVFTAVGLGLSSSMKPESYYRKLTQSQIDALPLDERIAVASRACNQALALFLASSLLASIGSIVCYFLLHP